MMAKAMVRETEGSSVLGSPGPHSRTDGAATTNPNDHSHEHAPNRTSGCKLGSDVARYNEDDRGECGAAKIESHGRRTFDAVAATVTQGTKQEQPQLSWRVDRQTGAGQSEERVADEGAERRIQPALRRYAGDRRVGDALRHEQCAHRQGGDDVEPEPLGLVMRGPIRGP